MSKKKKVPRRQLVDELRMANERILELAHENDTLRNRCDDTMRKLNAHYGTLNDLMKVTAIFHSLTDARMREVLSWPTT